MLSCRSRFHARQNDGAPAPIRFGMLREEPPLLITKFNPARTGVDLKCQNEFHRSVAWFGFELGSST